MAGVKNFTDLQIWRKARRWSKLIFDKARQNPFASDSRLVVQINDSSESVAANIAEGFGRGTQAEFITFLSYALGSLNETQSHLCAAYDRGYLSKSNRNSPTCFLDGSGVKHTRKPVSWSDQVWEIYERVTGKKRPALTTAFSRKPSERVRDRDGPVPAESETKENEPMSTEY